MKRLMLHFTKIMSLYVTVDESDPKYDEQVADLKGKYSAFARGELPKMLADLKLVRRITGHKVKQDGHKIETYNQYWLYKLYKFFRFFFITFYYYIFPFLIVIFSTLILYSKEIGKKQAEAEAAAQTGPPPQQNVLQNIALLNNG